MLPKPKNHIPSIAPYPPGKPIEEVQREYGLKSVIKLASNENPLGPSPKAVKAMVAASREMHLYPDGEGYFLKQALAKCHGIRPECIILGNGSDEITDMIALAYIESTNNVIISQHDFISYKLAAQMMGAACREVPLKDWQCDLDGMLKAADSKTKLICIANPSNPIGTMVSRKNLESFLAKAPAHALILLDEAYAEYVMDRSYPDGLKYVRKYPNLIVTRTFSKAYGLAGLRIGYGIANPEIIKNFDRVRPPFNANRMAQMAAIAALDDKNHLERSVRNNQQQMAALEAFCKTSGLEYVPSKTNFLLVDVNRSGGQVTESLLRQGVIVRPMGGYSLPRHIRITIGTPAENRRLIAALKKTLKEIPPSS